MNRLGATIAALITLGPALAGAATLEEGVALKNEKKLAEAASVFAEVVRDNPTDASALIQWATVLGWLGRYDESIAAWSRAVEQKPGDPDVVMGLARVEYWKGDLAPARKRMDALLAAAPNNADAFALAGDICSADHDLECAHGDYLRANEIAPSAELSKKLEGANGPLAWRFDSGGQIDSYDKNSGRGNEGSFFVQGSWQLASSLVLSGGYEQLHQFGQVDHRFNLGGYLHPLDGLLLTARVAVSPSENTIAPWEASGGVELHVAGPITALANVRHLDFSNQGVTIVGGGARFDSGAWSLMAQGGAVFSTINATQAFGTGRVEYAFSDDWRGYVGFARGAQAQFLLPTEIATDVTAGLMWQIDRQWGIRLDYTYEKFGDDTYVRNSVGSALTFKF